MSIAHAGEKIVVNDVVMVNVNVVFQLMSEFAPAGCDARVDVKTGRCELKSPPEPPDWWRKQPQPFPIQTHTECAMCGETGRAYNSEGWCMKCFEHPGSPCLTVFGNIAEPSTCIRSKGHRGEHR